MARIRTIKPEFFRHEGLQDLEVENPGAYCMLVFAGLWGHCDKAGRFEWKPRTLKLDILPFLDFGMASTLTLLEAGGFIRRYVVDGNEYGEILSFEKHQRISGKEAQEPEKFPDPQISSQGSNGEAIEKHLPAQEGKGREEEREKEGKGREGSTANASPVGLVCREIKASGITSVNPSHPTLIALVEAGATIEEFRSATIDAVNAGKRSFAYVLGIVKGRREDAAKLQLHKGPLPAKQRQPSGYHDSLVAAGKAIFGDLSHAPEQRIIDITPEPTAGRLGFEDLSRAPG